MSAVAVPSGFTAESFDAFIAARNEPVWLKAVRRAAWKQFLELPLPSRREEEWMRTDIRLFKLDKFAPAGQTQPIGSAAVPAPLLTAGVELGGSMSVVNGVVREASLIDEFKQKGVLFGSLDCARGRAWRQA
ncbi:MAG: hypothetical protein QM775_13665 [Pirellulales bacterium]